MLCSAGIADARQHVGDRISHAHALIRPCSAVSRTGLTEGDWLPASLSHARDQSRKCKLAEADSADAELSQECARSAAALTAIVLSHFELRLPLALLYHGLTRHRFSLL